MYQINSHKVHDLKGICILYCSCVKGYHQTHLKENKQCIAND